MPTNIKKLGKFGLIERINKPFNIKNEETIKAAGDDAAVIDCGKHLMLVSTELMLEGIHFDLTYTPLVHLGYKLVVAGIADIYAMNGKPKFITVAIGLSAKFDLEQVELIYKGIQIATEKYGIDLIGGDTSSSVNGLTLSITAIGEVDKDKIVYRNGANKNDLICVTGDLGAAFLGLKLLDREKRVLENIENPKPEFDGYEYLLQRQLKPEAPKDTIEQLMKLGIKPTAMIDISVGLASDLMQICKNSEKGARIYLNRIPIAKETFKLAEELNMDPVIAALNGGDDYELLFTIPISLQNEIENIPGTEIIGHIVPQNKGVALTTPDEQDIMLSAPGWGNENEDI